MTVGFREKLDQIDMKNWMMTRMMMTCLETPFKKGDILLGDCILFQVFWFKLISFLTSI